MFALVDCNNFYVSCERVFNPFLDGKPVVVLSNNDGCAIARSNESKALGIPMGGSWFELKELAKEHNIIALSSNYALYGDMSGRVMDLLREYTLQTEVYSIDESFLKFDNCQPFESFIQMGKEIREKIKQCLGLMVCVGFAPTKTLAKLANHVAKKNPEYNGVFNFQQLSQLDIDELFKQFDIGNIWGIGSRYKKRLNEIKVKNVYELLQINTAWIRKEFGVIVERTIQELKGIPCFELNPIPAPKQEIASSKSFSRNIINKQELVEVISTYLSRAAERMRLQGSVTNQIQVSLGTNKFQEDSEQYFASIIIPLQCYTDDTFKMVQAGLFALDKIYKFNIEYKSAGVLLKNLCPIETSQKSLFDFNESKTSKLMPVIDIINQKYGRDTVRLASCGLDRSWSTLFRYRSPNYTTSWDELPKAK